MPSSRSMQLVDRPPSQSSEHSGRSAISARRQHVAGEHDRRPSAVRTRSTTTTSVAGASRPRRSASSARAGSIWTRPASSRLACRPPGSRRSRRSSRPGCSAAAAGGPRTCPHPGSCVTNPSSSSDRSASRSVARDTPSSVASSGSGGSWLPGGTSPVAIRGRDGPEPERAVLRPHLCPRAPLTRRQICLTKARHSVPRPLVRRNGPAYVAGSWLV